jgi:hypothetical protein
MLENLNPAQKIDIPNEFRAALEFDGVNGTATLPAGNSDFEQFLIEQGFSPEDYEIVGNPRTSRWQKYDGDWLTSYRFNFRKKLNSDLDLQLLWKTAKQSAKGKTQKTTNSDKALVVMLADFQIGKADSRGGLQEQLERLFANFDELERIIAKGKYEQVILTDMGDIVEGFSNKADMQQLATNQASLMQQVDIATSLIWDLVKRASKYSAVKYATVASNHCQNRINKQAVGLPGQDDWGVFIARQIDRLSKELELSVQVLIPQPSDESLALDVFEDSFHILGLWHGHQSARPEAVPSWWEKQAFGNQPVSAASIGITGHFHHLRVQQLGMHPNGGSRYWIQAKTSDQGSSWYRLNAGSDSTPGINYIELQKGKHFTGVVQTV